MVLDLGFLEADKREFDRLLLDHHSIDIGLQLMDLEHNHLGDITPRLLSGQVSMDADATEATRSLTLELLDPAHELRIDTGEQADGSLYFTNMIRVQYGVLPPSRSRVLYCPIFTGPLVKAQRNGPVVSIEALGKEKLALSGVWTSKTYRKGQKKTTVMKKILRDLGGEHPSKIDIPDRRDKLPKDFTVARGEKPWEACQKLARSMSMQLFYDGRGVARLRNEPADVVFTYRERGALLSLPQVGYDSEAAINAVRVIGGKPKGAKKKVTHTEVAPRAHLLSPVKLGRNGVKRYLIETIEDDGIRSVREAKRVARRTLKRKLVQSLEVAFDSMPIPYLEEADMAKVVSKEFTGNFRVAKMTIPLTASGKSSMGYVRPVTPTRRAIALRSPDLARGRR